MAKTCALKRCGKPITNQNPGVPYMRDGWWRPKSICKSHESEKPNW